MAIGDHGAGEEGADLCLRLAVRAGNCRTEAMECEVVVCLIRRR